MISKKGIISSEGKVKVGNEMWNAVSIDGKSIAVGDTVVVRDIDGLRLVVEKSYNKLMLSNADQR